MATIKQCWQAGAVGWLCVMAGAVGCADGEDPSGTAGEGPSMTAGMGGGHPTAGAGGTNPGGGVGGGEPTAGTGAGGQTGGAGGTAGVGGAAGVGGGGFAAVPSGPHTAGGYMDLSPTMRQPLTPEGATVLTPPAPDGWRWYPIEGTSCRDGSPAGMFVRFGTVDKLYIWLEGGGACTNGGFCDFNPANVNSVLTGTGESVLGTALGVGAGRQQPGAYEGNVQRGMFDNANAANPFKDWNGVYIPYCTGDVHFGTRNSVSVPGVATAQKFVGYRNMERFVGHIVPTFKDKVDRVVITGGSAGSFGAALNFSMVQDAFKDVFVSLVMDSGVPFSDQYMPPCLQQRWRELWGLNDALPPDCAECFNQDGGGLVNLTDFLFAKHPNMRAAAISSTQDEVIRLFFSSGLRNCADIDTANPVGITLTQFLPEIYYAAAEYEAGITDAKDTYAPTGRLATYLMGGFVLAPLHQHTFRARYYDSAAGSKTLAAFVSDFIDGKIEHIGP